MIEKKQLKQIEKQSSDEQFSNQFSSRQSKQNLKIASKISHFLTSAFKFLFKLWKLAAYSLGSMFLFSVITMVIFIIVIVGSVDFGQSSETSSVNINREVLRQGGRDKIVVVRLSGEIVSEDERYDVFGSNPFSINPGRIQRVMDKIKNDESIKAAILVINSPGGSVVASEDIYQQLNELKDIIPVVMVFKEVAASGAYYIATAADQIVANPATITGSLGVISMVPNVADLYEKIGVDVNVIKSGQYKDIGNTAREMTDQEKQIFQSIVNESYEMFVDRIAKGRDISEARVRRLADGRIYSGIQASQNGLVDELGGIDQGINLATELANITNPTIFEYSSYSSWFDSFLSSTFGKMSNIVSEQSINLPGISELQKIDKQTRRFGVYYLLPNYY